MQGKKILMISNYDYAGSGYRAAEAINLNTNNFVQYIVLFHRGIPKGVRRYPSLFKSTLGEDGKEYRYFYKHDKQRVQSLIDWADIIHFKDDSPPKEDFIPSVNIPKDKMWISNVNGSSFRRGDSAIAQPIAEFSAYMDNVDARVVSDPELNYPEFDASFIPLPFDTDAYPNSWSNGKVPVIAHSPWYRGKKGTVEFIAAVKKLQKDGIAVEYDIIENESYNACLKRKSKATLFFDQNLAGFWGNSAIEAMAFGVPVLTYIADNLTSGSGGRINGQCPVINTGQTEESIYSALKGVLTNGTDLKELSKRTKEFVKEIHSYESVAKEWDKIYSNK